ncbi:zinc-binding dehydrogenase [Demequina sp. NBRC 110054]|uniref:zinc-binding dehydrogenase n=1 Tax=Demequina sp. NBRC 110054 TaxID=1570343 RepID=UPI000A04DD6C|nr:zinc-binding dehydrogenase [Demequina sp. NBRC 110054]
MKAWQFTGTHQPLVLNEVPEPTPGPGEVIIDVKAAGLCHSDVGVLEDEGWMALIPNLPVTMGHEISGVVSAVGEDVEDYAVGDRVGVCPTGPTGIAPGYGRDGGFAPKHRAAAVDLVRMPEGLSFPLAAAGTDAGMTSYHAMAAIGAVQAGEKVAVIGIGGLGQIGAQVAKVKGADVTVAEPNEAAWPMARQIGASRIVKDVSELEGEDFDLIVDYAGFGTTTAGAIKAVRFGGRVVQVGMGRLEATIDTRILITHQVSLLGSVGGTAQDVAEVYELFASGQVTPQISAIDFDEIAEGIEQLHQGKARGRVVALMDTEAETDAAAARLQGDDASHPAHR